MPAILASDATLLCEDCGYDLDDLRDQHYCPECGQTVEAILPSSRPGSPWQIRPGVRGWITTNLLALRRPGPLFRALRIDRGSSRTLGVMNLLIAAALLVSPWTGVLIGDPARASHGRGVFIEIITYALSGAAQVAVVFSVLLALTWVECLGIRFFARRRGWRLSRDAAWQVCWHASVGWMLAGLLPNLFMAVLYSAQRFLNFVPRGTLDLTLLNLPRLSWTQVSWGAAIIGGWLAGLFVFESLVYLGVRQCRFANRPGNPA